MTRLAVRLFALPAVAAVAALMATVQPAHLAGAEFDTESDIFAAADDPDLAAYNHALNQRLDAVAARTALKEDLIDQLVAGRIGLAAAADGFYRLNADVPEYWQAIRFQFPGATDDRELVVRNVIEYARQRVPAARWGGVERRLTAEQRDALRK